jgi:hypothetical protein
MSPAEVEFARCDPAHLFFGIDRQGDGLDQTLAKAKRSRAAGPTWDSEALKYYMAIDHRSGCPTSAAATLQVILAASLATSGLNRERRPSKVHSGQHFDLISQYATELVSSGCLVKSHALTVALSGAQNETSTWSRVAVG